MSMDRKTDKTDSVRSTMKWYAIEYIQHFGNPTMGPRRVGPHLVRAEGFPGIVYWGFGPSHWELHEKDKVKILKDYGPYSESGRDPWPQFVRDFPPAPTSANDPCEGWLSRQGELFAFDYGEHTSTAKELCIIHRYRPNPSWDYEGALLKRGWINLRWSMKFLSIGDGKKPNAAQIDRL